MKKTKEELIADMEEYFVRIKYAFNWVHVYERFYGKDPFDSSISFEHNMDLKRFAPAFDRYVKVGLLIAAELETAKLFDSDPKAKTIEKLINCCEQSKLFDNKMLNAFRDELVSLNVDIVSLRNQRDWVLTHNDKKGWKSGIKAGYDIVKLLWFALRVCNEFMNTLKGEHHDAQAVYDSYLEQIEKDMFETHP